MCENDVQWAVGSYVCRCLSSSIEFSGNKDFNCLQRGAPDVSIIVRHIASADFGLPDLDIWNNSGYDIYGWLCGDSMVYNQTSMHWITVFFSVSTSWCSLLSIAFCRRNPPRCISFLPSSSFHVLEIDGLATPLSLLLAGFKVLGATGR